MNVLEENVEYWIKSVREKRLTNTSLLNQAALSRGFNGQDI